MSLVWSLMWCILVNLDSSPIEVIDCRISDQDLFTSNRKNFLFIAMSRSSVGVYPVDTGDFWGRNQLPYEVDCSPSSWAKLNVCNFALLLCIFKCFRQTHGQDYPYLYICIFFPSDIDVSVMLRLIIQLETDTQGPSGPDLNPWSNLCAGFSACGLEPSLPKMENIWECENPPPPTPIHCLECILQS